MHSGMKGTDVEEAVNGNPEASDTTKPVKKKPSKAILSLIPVFASVILDTMGVSIVVRTCRRVVIVCACVRACVNFHLESAPIIDEIALN